MFVFINMRLLFVEGDRRIIKELVPLLRELFIIDTAYCSTKALVLSEANFYDVILLDDDMYGMKGLELCRMMREIDIDSPILLIINENDKENRLMGFDAGADVIIQKPLISEEVVAQINVLARRNGKARNSSNLIRIGNMCLDMKDKLVQFGDCPIELRRKEFDLLEYLAINHGRIISKEEILEHVWEKGLFIFSNTVEVHVRGIRLKFMKGAGARVIKTCRGFGYKIET